MSGKKRPLKLEITPTIPVTKVHPRESIHWTERTAHIERPNGEVVYHLEGIEAPEHWSDTAVNIAASRYFHGNEGEPDRERSMAGLISRVASRIATWTVLDNLLEEAAAMHFERELYWLCANQKMAFNSPVWFNVGVREPPQCSACFINPVEDSMESILGLSRTEGMIFKWGSGTGTNFSSLRSSGETLTGGGTASGPVSFMEGFDAFAGVIKSGGQTRRAAKMAILNIDHPDIVAFVTCKAKEEEKAHALVEAGFPADFDDPDGAYASVRFQNANHSVRVTDAFMEAVERDEDWTTKTVVGGHDATTYRAEWLYQQMATAAWTCGDPGIQFDDSINGMHTCIDTSRIHGSNPCSEFMFVDGSACNLASLNLLKFLCITGPKPIFDIVGFQAAAQRTIIAQDAMVNHASYPTDLIEKNAWDYRPLGLGYANLGGLLMSLGLPYDSEEGRLVAAAITSLMTAVAYRTSAQLAQAVGPFRHWEANREGMLGVIERHMESGHELAIRFESATASGMNPNLASMLKRVIGFGGEAWVDALELGREHGFRNAQVSLLAPTGTVGMMMDCDTTGVEPEFALTKYKKLVGGGTVTTVNRLVPQALAILGYSYDAAEEILTELQEGTPIEDVKGLKPEHLPVFDCSAQTWEGGRYIEPEGHIRMMGAVQPFLSGAISKTVNLPSSATPEDIAELWKMGWKLGLKAIAVYRNGCKPSQPLTTSKTERQTATHELSMMPDSTEEIRKLVRKHMPEERLSVTHKFRIGEHEGYVTVGLFPDGRPGEIFVTISKEGTVISGLMNVFTTAVSIALQYGVPLEVLCEKFEHTRFDPSGLTAHSDSRLRFAKSITDYLFRWMRLRFVDGEGIPDGSFPKMNNPSSAIEAFDAVAAGAPVAPPKPRGRMEPDGEVCKTCGTLMERSGSCHRCPNCGGTSGCS